MSEEPSFADLAERLRRGDGQAANLLYERFARRLVGLARLHLNFALRSKIDPEDVMQSAWKSFFRRQADGELDLQSWDALWSLLTVITVRKRLRQAERFRAARRDVRRERALEVGDDPAERVGSRTPPPYETAVLTEMVEHLFRDLSGREGQILQLTLEGHAAAEAAALTGASERTVYRLLERIRARLERLRDADAGD